MGNGKGYFTPNIYSSHTLALSKNEVKIDQSKDKATYICTLQYRLYGKKEAKYIDYRERMN